MSKFLKEKSKFTSNHELTLEEKKFSFSKNSISNSNSKFKSSPSKNKLDKSIRKLGKTYQNLTIDEYYDTTVNDNIEGTIDFPESNIKDVKLEEKVTRKIL